MLISVIDIKELDNVGVAMDTPKNGHLQLQPAVVTRELNSEATLLLL